MIKSIDRDELAKYLSQKSVPEDDEEEVCLMLLLPISNMKLDCIILCSQNILWYCDPCIFMGEIVH